MHVIGINADVQFCTAENPKFIKQVLVLNIVNKLAEVVSVNENNCVPALYAQVILYAFINKFIAAAKAVPPYNAFGGIITALFVPV